MKATKQRLAIGLIGLATLLAGSSAIAQDAPIRLQQRRAISQRTVTPQRITPVETFIAEPVQPSALQVTQVSPQIPPRPEMCVPDYSWFDYEQWEWVCVGHQ